MAHDDARMDWDALAFAGETGSLSELLPSLPRARWTERNRYGDTLLHHACLGSNVAAVVTLLASGLLDVNERNEWQRTPAHDAAASKQPRVLELLCAAGADLQARSVGAYEKTPLEDALHGAAHGSYECARVLVANGARLSTVGVHFRSDITPELVAFERGVLRCRAAVVAMLCVKRTPGRLVRWDRFLLAHLAFELWATRSVWPSLVVEALDWNGVVKREAEAGCMMPLLASLPRARWKEVNPKNGHSLLHYACFGDNLDAVVALLVHGVDVSACGKNGFTPAHWAAMFGRARILEVLCAAGARLRSQERGDSVLDVTVVRLAGLDESTRVLLANGVRVASLRRDLCNKVAPELFTFERGVLRCRAATVAMLRVKLSGNLVRWDRFLLRELALQVWATRTNAPWCN